MICIQHDAMYLSTSQRWYFVFQKDDIECAQAFPLLLLPWKAKIQENKLFFEPFPSEVLANSHWFQQNNTLWQLERGFCLVPCHLVQGQVNRTQSPESHLSFVAFVLVNISESQSKLTNWRVRSGHCRGSISKGRRKTTVRPGTWWHLVRVNDSLAEDGSFSEYKPLCAL